MPSRIIIQNCNMCTLDIPIKYANKLYNEFQVRHPNAFYLRYNSKMKGWDGKIKFISKTGQFRIGLLPRVYKECRKLGLRPTIVDTRKPLPKVTKVVDKIGKFQLREEQIQAVQSVVLNKFGTKYPFQSGVLDYTVNAGKSLIMASLYLTYKRKLKTLILVNDSDWLQQAKSEFKDYLPGEPITFVQGKVPKPWNNFSIGMVQSIAKNIKYYQSELSSIDMVLIDEADQAGSKTYQSVITHLLNTRVRVGLSGTIYMSKLAKDKLKNWNLESYLGQTLAKFNLVDSIKKGYSTKTIVKCISPAPYYRYDYNDMLFDYDAIYKSVIIENPHGYEMILSRVKYNMKYGRLPLLVVCKFIKHCELVHEYLEKHLPGIKIAHVHVQTPTKQRHQILKDFKDGKIQILVSTTIIARGKNMPLLKCLINAASMDAREKTIQILGRIVRTHASKNKVYLDDIQYPGDYLARHAKHRKNYYYQQRLKVVYVGPKKQKRHRSNHRISKS